MKIEFQVSLDEWRDIAEYARASGLTIDAFVRLIVLREIKPNEDAG